MTPSIEVIKNPGFSRTALCGLLLLLMAVCPVLVAQTDLSTIRGTVTDPTGAVIPSVTITLLNTETGISRTVETGATGDYEIPLVGPRYVRAHGRGGRFPVVRGERHPDQFA